MATTYEMCDGDVTDLMKAVMKKHHPELVECEAAIQCLFADAGMDKKGNAKDAVKLHGRPCYATVRVTTLKQRAAGNADAEIVIDRRKWEQLSEDQQRAVLDHELEHLKPKRECDDEKAPIKCDDQGRPKLKIKPHDGEVGIFKCIIERHGRNAIDYEQAQMFRDQFGQLLMWADDAASVG